MVNGLRTSSKVNSKFTRTEKWSLRLSISKTTRISRKRTKMKKLNCKLKMQQRFRILQRQLNSNILVAIIMGKLN